MADAIWHGTSCAGRTNRLASDRRAVVRAFAEWINASRIYRAIGVTVDEHAEDFIRTQLGGE